MSKHITPSAESLLAAALDYYARGWSVIPTKPRSKAAAVRWQQYQTERPTDAQVSKWFGAGKGHGIAVVFGASGALVDREWDILDAYQAWAAAYPHLAATLPTVETPRGRHVYCYAAPGSIEAVRTALGKPNSNGAIPLGDGELRAGCCYSLLPPSIHPDGPAYRWIVPLLDRVPTLDLRELGFFSSDKASALQSGTERDGEAQSKPSVQSVRSGTESHTLSLQSTSAYSAYSVGQSADENLLARIEAAIRATQPKRLGERRRCLFEFARHVKALPALADAPLSALRPYVRRWHETAVPIIGTKPFDDSWFDFTKALAGVKYPAGSEPIAKLLALADAAEPPDVALEYDHPALRRLVALCRELQRAAGVEPFYLSARTGERLLSIHYTTVFGWLGGLCRDRVLELVKRGSQAAHKASRYHYLPPL